MPPRSSFTTSTLSTLHTRSTSCHPDLKAGRLGSRGLSLRYFQSSGPWTTLLLPGDHLASFGSAPSFLLSGWRSSVGSGGATTVSGCTPAALATPSLASPAGHVISLLGFRSLRPCAPVGGGASHGLPLLTAAVGCPPAALGPAAAAAVPGFPLAGSPLLYFPLALSPALLHCLFQSSSSLPAAAGSPL